MRRSILRIKQGARTMIPNKIIKLGLISGYIKTSVVQMGLKGFDHLKELGIDGIEISRKGYGRVSTEEAIAYCLSIGLRCSCIHVGGICSAAESVKDVQETIRLAQKAESPYAVITYAPCDSEAWVMDNRETINRMAFEASKQGVVLCYHNHAAEFTPHSEDTETIMDLLLENTDPEYVKLQLDVGWAAYAGIDPAAFLRKYPQRVAILHLRDLQEVIPDSQPEWIELGQGLIDYPALLTAAKAAGVTWADVERARPFRDHSEISSIHQSLAFLRKVLPGPPE
jgi:sugar phosphate isomerase/epimerase